MKRILSFFAGLLLIAAGLVEAETARQSAVANPSVVFEAASLKVNNSGISFSGIGTSNGSLMRITNYTLKGMIQYAYGVRDFQVSGGPSWVASDRYDVVAKPETAQKPEVFQQMLQNFLADRFQLRVHKEAIDAPIYVLSVAKNGPILTPAAVRESGGMNISGSKMTATGVGMEQLVTTLSTMVRRQVVDRTGLEGRYDFQLNYSPDLGLSTSHDSLTDSGPSIFTALQEQLGLRLDSSKGPVESVVINHAEKPTED